VLLTPVLPTVLDEPILTVVAALGSLVVGVGAGLSRWRVQIGMIGLAVVTVGLVILSFLLEGDRTYETGAQVATAALLVLGVIALTNHITVHTPTDTPINGQGLLQPAAGALLVATLLVAFIAATGRAGAPEGR
jgi:hypothetical protein